MKIIETKFLTSFQRDKSGCWIWQETKDKDGYGRFILSHEKEIRAHRFSYEFFKKKIPKNLLVLHKCDNPSCVNPKHLKTGTVLDNHRDMDKKKRRISVSGEKHGGHKLTENQVNEIRELFLNNNYTHQELCLIFSVCRRTISLIVNNKIWKHAKRS